MVRGWGEDTELLKRGPREWNAWRRRHREYIPQLSEADLENSDLRGANLAGADLRGAYLSGAKLQRANLRAADLRRAHLLDGYFTGTDLRCADLRRADLRGSKLIKANLAGAILDDTILDPRRWTRAILQLWEDARPENRRRLVEALQNRTALHRGWRKGTSACPEAILSDKGAKTDDFMYAWRTGGVSEEQLLKVLMTTPARAISAGYFMTTAG